MNFSNLAIRLERLVNLYNTQEKQPKEYVDGILLYRSELHMIDVIGKHPGINTTKLASILGITKGAVTQNTNRLVQKGMLLRLPSKTRGNEITLQLTENGKAAYCAHEDYHKEMMSGCREALSKFTDAEFDKIDTLLSTFETYLVQKGE